MERQTQRGIKRPRSAAGSAASNQPPGSSPSSGGTNKPPGSGTRSTRKPSQHKKKSNKGGGGSGAAGGSGGAGGGGAGGNTSEQTATAEGSQMAQALSTFTNVEQERFEAFRRCAFSGDVVSTFVAHCLADNEERRFAEREGARRILGGAGISCALPGEGKGGRAAAGDISATAREEASLRRSPYVVEDLVEGNGGCDGDGDGGRSADGVATATPREDQPPRLCDLVMPNASQEIVCVVSTLAKAYAQRLVTAARRVASAEGYSDELPLLPRHIMEAHVHRVRAGVDPGFFLQPPECARRGRGVGGCSGGVAAAAGGAGGTASCAAALGTVDRYSLKLAAAQAAQNAYDAHVGEETSEETAATVHNGGGQIGDTATALSGLAGVSRKMDVDS